MKKILQRLCRTFLIDDCRLPIFGSATPLIRKGQRRLSSTNQQSKIGNRQYVAPPKRLLDCKTCNGLVALLLTGLCASSFAAKQPNILFIAVDDLKPMFGCYGDETILTPNIDKMAERGTVFLNNACQQSVCAPSRVSMMTGTYIDTTKVYDLRTQMRVANPDTLTLPEYFKQHGYETTGTGKVYDPRSVDQQYDAVSWTKPFQHHPLWDKAPKGTPRAIGGPYHNPEAQKQRKQFDAYLAANGIKDAAVIGGDYHVAQMKFPLSRPHTEGWDVPDEGYQDGIFPIVAKEQMEELAQGDKPFFLAVGFAKPHLPFCAPKKYWDLYDPADIELAPFQDMPKGAPEFAFQDSWELRSCFSGTPAGPVPEDLQRELIHGYRACVSFVDAQIGKVIDHLDELGLADNTIIVLWGDHGFHLGEHGIFCKHTNYELAVRSPLIIAAPSQKAKGTKTMSPTEFVDVFPTLCELAGLPIPETVEGISILPILNDPDAMVHEAALEQYPRNNSIMGYTLRDKRYRYVKWITMDYYGGERTGPVAATELYDYDKDPLETVNLVTNPEYKDIVANFERIFKKRGIAQETEEIK